jgi:folate receptor
MELCFVFILLFGNILAIEQLECLNQKIPEPKPFNSSYHECFAWSELACCDPIAVEEIHELYFDSHVYNGLYNFTWNLCPQQRNLSDACAQYHRQESCFYECSPYLGPFIVGPWDLQNVPICDYYCDAWFEACKDDYTCQGDWSPSAWENPKGHENGLAYYCNATECQTYSSMYGDSKGLCEKIWGNTFQYSSDHDTCYLMWWNGTKNPNARFFGTNDDFESSGTAISLSLFVELGVLLILFKG